MGHPSFLKFFLHLLIFSLVLTACSGESEEPISVTDEPETAVAPTNTTAPVENNTSETDNTPAAPTAETSSTPNSPPDITMTPTATITLGESIRAAEGGFAVLAIPDYTIEKLSDSIMFTAPDADPDLGPIFILAGGPLEEGETVDTLVADFQEEFIADDAMELSEPQVIFVQGLDGYVIEFSGEEGEENIFGQLAIVTDGKQVFTMFGGSEASRWENETNALFDTLLNSVTVFEPEVAIVPAEESVPPAAELAPAESTESDIIEATAVSPTEPGFACFGSPGQGVTCLTATGEWQSFTRESSALGGDYISDISVCDDGTMLIAHSSGISAFDGENWREYDSGWDYGSADRVTCAPNGQIWVAHYEGASTFDGNVWTTYGSEQLEPPTDPTGLIEDIAIDTTGNVWVVAANSIAKFTDNEWTVYSSEAGLDDTYFFNAITIDANGQPWAAHSSGLLTMDGGKWVAYENDDLYTLQALAIDQNNNKWVGTFSQGLAEFDGASWARYDRNSGDLSSDQINTVAVDGNGRIWVGTEYGLAVNEGGVWTTYRMDNADIVDHNINAIGIIGAGPVLPPTVTKTPGSLEGVLIQDEDPLADTAVELCVEPLTSFFTGDSPCSEQPLFFTARTDSNGRFAFDELPVGSYVIAVDTGDGWAQLTTEYGFGSERVPVLAGEAVDVGELTVLSE